MGCERGSDGEALSDYLIALRGLLDAVDEAGQPTLGRRLAALCAEEGDRQLLMSRVDAALNLELALIAGVPIDAWTPPPGMPSGRELIGEIEEHLRALLRDVVCGYLDHDLAPVADEILLAGSEPIEIHARDLREEPEPDWPEPQLDLDPELEPVRANDGPGTAADPRSAAWAVASLPGPRTQREWPPPPRAEDRVDDLEAYEDDTIADRPLPRFERAAPAAEPEPQPAVAAEEPTLDDTGVTPSADWDFDEDAASYSAPI
jgi:hypothetical protein